MTALLNTSNLLQLPYFSTYFDKTGIKVNGLLNTLHQETLTRYVALSFNYLHFLCDIYRLMCKVTVIHSDPCCLLMYVLH